jgi:hypothetical protein
MDNDKYSKLYDALNWDAPDGPIRCTVCSDLGMPNAGAYPTALTHFERILGPKPYSQEKTRPIAIFLDPRPSENNFLSVNPHNKVSENEHRYFCLTHIAWRSLDLDKMTNSSTPTWPNSYTEHMYLRRYLSSRGGSWSYDGFLAYFICFFKSEDALITNLAKCHFGETKQKQAYKNCASSQLTKEVNILRANLVLSFTSLLDRKFVKENVPSLVDMPIMSLFHPAARVSVKAKSERFIEELKKNENYLSEQGHNVDSLVEQWMNNVETAMQL